MEKDREPGYKLRHLRFDPAQTTGSDVSRLLFSHLRLAAPPNVVTVSLQCVVDVLQQKSLLSSSFGGITICCDIIMSPNITHQRYEHHQQISPSPTHIINSTNNITNISTQHHQQSREHDQQFLFGKPLGTPAKVV